MTYVVLLERVEARSQCDYLATAMQRAMGADVPITTPDDARITFVNWLESDLEKVDDEDPEIKVLREALFPERR